MRASTRPEKVLRLIEPSRQQWVCQSCRRRQFSTSRAFLAELPWYRRMQETLFGTKEGKAAQQTRKDLTEKRFEELRERPRLEKEVKVDQKTGLEYEVADIIDPSIDTDYVAKTTWDGLERIGSEAWVKRQADSGEKFAGFAPRKHAILRDQEWRRLLRHVAVEVLALKQRGRDVMEVCTISPQPRATRTAKIESHGRLASGSGTSLEALLDGVLGSEEMVSLPTTALHTIIQGSRQDHDDWASVELADPSTKLAISKRIYQLTGRRITDFNLSISKDLGRLFDTCKTPPKTMKLHEAPQIKQVRVLPNVTVRNQRVTPMDKDKAVGRWKVIEEELLKRDLPTTGNRLRGAKIYLPKLQGPPKKSKK